MPEQPQENKNNKALIFIVITLALAVLGFGVYYFVIRDDSDTNANSNVNTNAVADQNTNSNQNTNTSLLAGTKTCNLDIDCEARIVCDSYDCYNKDAAPDASICDKTLNPSVLENVSCVCAERECTLVEDETADWQTYTNNDYYYEIKYPAEYYQKDIGPTDKYMHFSSKNVDSPQDIGQDGIWLTFRMDLNEDNTSLAEFAAAMPFNTEAESSDKSELTVHNLSAIKQLEFFEGSDITPDGYSWVTYLVWGDKFYSIRAVALNQETISNFKSQYDAIVNSFMIIRK